MTSGNGSMNRRMGMRSQTRRGKRPARRQRERAAPSAWALGMDLFGADQSPAGQGNVSGRVKSLIRGKLRAKHPR